MDSPGNLRANMPEPIYRIDTTEPAGLVARLTADPAVVDAALFGREVRMTVSPDSGTDLFELLNRHGVPPRNAALVSPSLEDVFVSHVRRAGGAPSG